MTTPSSVRRAATALTFVFACALAWRAGAKDVYKGFLDPSIPQHHATLDLLARIDKDPNDASLHNDLGCLIARDGFWRDALREFDIASKLDPKDGRASYNAGLVQTTRGNWSSARSAFKKAVDRSPGNWSAWWMLGFAEEKLGNANAAVHAYATSLRVDTSLFDVRRNPYAIQSRLKGRTLLETYDARMARAALPATEQLAQPDLLTGYQTGKVGVAATTGAPVAEEPAEGVSGPVPVRVPPSGGAPAPAPPAAGPGPGFAGGAVVTSVPPVSSSRPAPAPLVAPAERLPEAPPSFPTSSPAGPAPAKTPAPPRNDDPGAPETVPTPAPRPVGPGIG